MRAIEQAQNLLNQLSIGDSALRFISRPPKWLDCEKYLHCQQPYGMQYYLHEILSMDNITELNESYPTSTNLQNRLWIGGCALRFISPPKVVRLFTASNHTACDIAYMKYFLWAILQSWMRATNEHKISKINSELVVAHWDSYHAFQRTVRDIFTVSNHTAFSHLVLTKISRIALELLDNYQPSRSHYGWSCWRITDLCTKKVE